MKSLLVALLVTCGVCAAQTKPAATQPIKSADAILKLVPADDYPRPKVGWENVAADDAKKVLTEKLLGKLVEATLKLGKLSRTGDTWQAVASPKQFASVNGVTVVFQFSATLATKDTSKLKGFHAGDMVTLSGFVSGCKLMNAEFRDGEKMPCVWIGLDMGELSKPAD